jgi:hypothetical protein
MAAGELQMKTFPYLMLSLVLSACATQQPGEGLTVTNIRIDTQGNSLEDSDEMRSVCAEFQLTREQVRIFARGSRPTSEAEIHDDFNILPCYSAGTASINGERYQWIIRAGGVGEFFNNDRKLLRVCEGKCCSLADGIC